MARTLEEFAKHLLAMPAALTIVQHEILEDACKIVEEEAKRVIGTYDYGWPQLAPATQEDRTRKGFSANEPLLRTGELRDSITHEVVSHDTAYVGSTSLIAKYQELGTSKIPPRPFLGGATAAKEEEIHEIGAKGLHKAITGVLIP